MNPTPAGPGVRRGLAALLRDILRLGDLQLQLLKTDLVDFWNQARGGIVLLLAGGVAMLAALPVVILGVSYYFSQATELSLAAAMLLVSLFVLACAGLAMWISIRQLTRAGSTFDRSQRELHENLTFIRTMLHHDDE